MYQGLFFDIFKDNFSFFLKILNNLLLFVHQIFMLFFYLVILYLLNIFLLEYPLLLVLFLINKEEIFSYISSYSIFQSLPHFLFIFKS